MKNSTTGCLIYRQNKDARTEALGSPRPLNLPHSRWGSISIDFITRLPWANDGYDGNTTYVNFVSKLIYVYPCKNSDTTKSL